MIYIISTSYENIQSEGSFFWGENYFPSIRNYIPLNTTDVISIAEGILYFNKSHQKEKPALRLKIIQSHITRLYLKVTYSVIRETEYKSYQIRNALKQYFQKKSVLELPFCCAVNEDRFNEILTKSRLYSELNYYETQNKWNEIYKILESNFPIEKSELWNNHEILNSFSFATAKLSECTENLKRKFPDKLKRNEFIKQKKYFRELTIKLRLRCIELSPDNPVYYSNIAYTYYQSVNELNTPNGRRDGNINREAEKAIEYLEKALVLDSTRITDIYRKAMLLSEILPNYTLYKSEKIEQVDGTVAIREKYLSATEMIQRGIDEFIKLVRIYENLHQKPDANKLDTTQNAHYKKYYIKALYHIAQKKIKLTKIQFNLINLLYGYKPLQCQSNDLNRKISELNIANSYIEKCIQADYTKKKEEKYLIDLVECDNFISAVYKAYLKAVIETYLYVLTDKHKHLINAKDYFHKALELNFPREQKNQNKMFIIEKMATLNLIEGKYDAAIRLLEPLYNRSQKNKSARFPEYASFTLTIGYILIGDKQKAKQLIDENLNCGNKIFEVKFDKLNNYLFNEFNYSKLSEKNQSNEC